MAVAVAAIYRRAVGFEQFYLPPSTVWTKFRFFSVCL